MLLEILKNEQGCNASTFFCYYCTDIKVHELDSYWVHILMQNYVVTDPVIVLDLFDLFTIWLSVSF